MKKYEFQIRTFDRVVSDDGVSVNTIPIDTLQDFYLSSETDLVIAQKDAVIDNLRIDRKMLNDELMLCLAQIEERNAIKGA